MKSSRYFFMSKSKSTEWEPPGIIAVLCFLGHVSTVASAGCHRFVFIKGAIVGKEKNNKIPQC